MSNDKTEKAALTVFLSLAALVYATAFTYCILTKNMFAAYLEIVAITFLTVFITVVVRGGRQQETSRVSSPEFSE